MNTQDNTVNTPEVQPLTEREIVLETLAYYGMGGRFGYDAKTQSCHYLDPQTGNRCAVGRCLATGIYDDRQASFEELDCDLEEDFKPQYRDPDTNFWSALQSLHDYAAQGYLDMIFGILCTLDFDSDEVMDPMFRLSYPAFFYEVR